MTDSPVRLFHSAWGCDLVMLELTQCFNDCKETSKEMNHQRSALAVLWRSRVDECREESGWMLKICVSLLTCLTAAQGNEFVKQIITCCFQKA